MNLKNNCNVTKTKQTKNLSLGGRSEIFEVYQIPLDLLYFNNINDRISTFISKYEDENKNFPLDYKIMGDKYNDIIHNFIKESKLDAFTKTKKNILNIDQREPGIVLNDGRIIDGNRRFCCLRELHKENPAKFGFFNAVILDEDIENHKKRIKILELMVQQGEDKKVDYGPIERLVGIYKNIIKNDLLTVSEYASSIGEEEKTVKDEVEVAKLLIEFLEFFNCSEKFYIAKELSLDGPIRELWNIIKNKSEEEGWKIKQAVFTILAIEDGDKTRYIRNLGKIIKNFNFKNSFLDESEELVKIELKNLPTKTDLDYFKSLQSNEELKSKFSSLVTKFKDKTDSAEIKDRPISLLNKSLDALKSIDTNVFMKFNEIQKRELKELCKQIEKEIFELIGKINV